MGDFVIDSNNRVYCDYFNASLDNMIGILGDSIEDMTSEHERVIKKNMPVLNDEKCLSCPVIGACWGWCCNLTGIIRPSEHCDQVGLLSKINEKAGKGMLANYLMTPNCRN
jgi:radical SAM protein with 4Fe4S-binding SPASM domain